MAGTGGVVDTAKLYGGAFVKAVKAGPTGQDLVDYIGIIVVTPPETLRFALRVTPTGEPPRELDFVREFYP